jgi:hypothetical protein
MAIVLAALAALALYAAVLLIAVGVCMRAADGDRGIDR